MIGRDTIVSQHPRSSLKVRAITPFTKRCEREKFVRRVIVRSSVSDSVVLDLVNELFRFHSLRKPLKDAAVSNQNQAFSRRWYPLIDELRLFDFRREAIALKLLHQLNDGSAISRRYKLPAALLNPVRGQLAAGLNRVQCLLIVDVHMTDEGAQIVAAAEETLSP